MQILRSRQSSGMVPPIHAKQSPGLGRLRPPGLYNARLATPSWHQLVSFELGGSETFRARKQPKSIWAVMGPGTFLHGSRGEPLVSKLIKKSVNVVRCEDLMKRVWSNNFLYSSDSSCFSFIRASMGPCPADTVFVQASKCSCHADIQL